MCSTGLQPVPIGVSGELYLGGVSLSRGYLGRPDLTAERFVVDPFCDLPGARMYRTGDAVRWRADGELEFLGRIDGQVKIRGFRVELGEVEATLQQQEGVQQAVVVVTDNRLVAYVLAVAPLSDDKLRAGLARVLPEYMVPSAFVRVESFPLTTSGKVDRKALPEPELRRSDNTPYESPRTPLEESIAAIWSELLGVEGIGIDDDYFRLGGHSLMAADRGASDCHSGGLHTNSDAVREPDDRHPGGSGRGVAG